MRGLFLFVLFIAATTLHAQTTVPFVGCPSDGQTGPLASPKDAPKPVNLPKSIAAKLAYYQDENGDGVLGPRGWRCFGTYGSNGASLYISPIPIASDFLLRVPHANFYGPAIQLSTSIGDTSGRFEVAEIIRRLFPSRRDHAEEVVQEHLLLDKLPTGPASTDTLHYLSHEAVEYTTPPNHDGEGTHSWLVKNDQPITGVVVLTGEELSATSLAIRLPANLVILAPYITHQLEHEAAVPHP